MPIADACCAPLSVNCQGLKNCELRSYVRTSSVLAGIAAGVLAGVFAQTLPIYAIGLLAGGGGLLILASCIDCCRQSLSRDNNNAGILEESVADWAAGQSDLIPLDPTLRRNLNKKTVEGKTALHLAAENGFKERCKKLINLGADTKMVSSDLKSIFHFVCAPYTHSSVDVHTRIDLINYFYTDSEWNLNLQNVNKLTPLDYANQLCRRKDSFRPLRQCLIEKKAQTSEQIEDADARGKRLTVAWIGWALGTKKDFNPTEAEIHENIYTRSEDGETLLLIAASAGQLERCKLLVSLGANMHVFGQEHMSVMHYVLSPDRKLDYKTRMDLITYFCDFEVDLYATAENGLTALDFAVNLQENNQEYKSLCDFLREKGAKNGPNEDYED